MKHAGHQDELGFNIRGTTDVALVVKQALGVGLPRVGIKWLWELKKDLGGRQEQDSSHNFEEVLLLGALLKIAHCQCSWMMLPLNSPFILSSQPSAV